MTKPRKIVIDGQEFRWLTRRSGPVSPGQVVSVWDPGNRRAVLLVQFDPPRTRDPDFAQSPLDRQGWVATGLRSYNLNRPAVVADLIREARSRGWDAEGRRPWDLDGFALLRECPERITHELLYDSWLELATQLVEHRAELAGRPALAWLRERTERPWPQILRADPTHVALAVAGLMTFDVLLESVATLGRSHLAELTVEADARQARGQPGGLVLAAWLAGQPSLDAAEQIDLRAWCSELLPRCPVDSQPTAPE